MELGKFHNHVNYNIVIVFTWKNVWVEFQDFDVGFDNRVSNLFWVLSEMSLAFFTVKSYRNEPKNPGMCFVSFHLVDRVCFSMNILHDTCELTLLRDRRQILLLILTHILPMLHFCTPWKLQQNRRFSDVFRGYRNVTLGEYGLSESINLYSLWNSLWFSDNFRRSRS